MKVANQPETCNTSAGISKASTSKTRSTRKTSKPATITRSNTIMSAKFDLSKLNTKSACDKGVDVELHHPSTNVPLGMFITIIGKDSQEFRDFTREKTNTRLRKDSDAQRRGKNPEIRTVEGIEAENIELLVTCTKGWRGIEKDGVELPFSVQNAIMIYKEYPWIYSQINDAIGDYDNFLK